MYVGREYRGVVERTHAHEANGRASAVVAPQRRLAFRAAIDVVGAAAFGRNGYRFGRTSQNFQPIGFDQCVDDESAPGLALAIAAVAAMHKHRFRAQAMAHTPARAPTLKSFVHATSSRKSSSRRAECARMIIRCLSAIL